MEATIYNNVLKDKININFFDLSQAAQDMATRLGIVNSRLISDRSREDIMIRMPTDLQDKIWSNTTIWLQGQRNGVTVVYGVTLTTKHDHQGQLDSLGIRGFYWVGSEMGKAPKSFVEADWDVPVNAQTAEICGNCGYFA